MADATISHRTCSICGQKHYARGLCSKHYEYARAHGEFTKLRYTGHLPLKERLAAFSKKSDDSGCILWTAHRSAAGYGRIGVGGTVLLAHRVAYELTYGPIPESLFVCHHCDTPACINSSHLFLGTNAENTQDKVMKNRQLKGETVPNSFLTEAEVLAIRADRRRQTEIAEQYKISISHVSLLRRGQEWRHLGPTSANYRDGKIDNGHQVRGIAHPIAKLDDDAVRAIRLSSGTAEAVALQFCVSATLIRRVRRREAWTHVE